jgi:hypothetical protein
MKLVAVIETVGYVAAGNADQNWGQQTTGKQDGEMLEAVPIKACTKML